MKKYVTYLRVSTSSQGIDGNGIDAQRNAVNAFAEAEGSTIIKEFIEEESGSHDLRPVMIAALRHAQACKAVLLVKTLDRISRDLHFITALEKSDVAFKIVDMPNADSFTLHIYGSLAQRERELISIRTTAALKSLKERGITKTGKVYVAGKVENFTQDGRAKGAVISREVRTLKATEYNKLLLPVIEQYRLEKLGYKVIAEKLNAEGFKTRKGGLFHAASVQRMMV